MIEKLMVKKSLANMLSKRLISITETSEVHVLDSMPWRTTAISPTMALLV
jgi:hypothetical protein